MDSNIIVEEYLNHFYTYEELATYLNEDLDRIAYILNTVGGRYGKLVKQHKAIIDRYNSGDLEDNIETTEDHKIVELANYIIKNNSSLRKTAKAFKISKSSVGEYMSEALPKISITLYKQVFDILMEHKSLSAKYRSRSKEISKEMDLLDGGLTLGEIATKMDKTFSAVQRDLAIRTEIISPKMNKDIKIRLRNIKSHKASQ